MINIDKSQIIRKYEVQIKAYRELIPCISEAIPVIQRFDGKVFNVKLEKALEELTNAYYYVRRNNYGNSNVSIEVQLKQRHYTMSGNGCNIANYDFTSNNTMNITLINNRIDAKSTIENLEKSIKTLTTRIEHLDHNYACLNDNIELYIKTCEQIKDYNATLDEVTRGLLRIESRYL